MPFTPRRVWHGSSDYGKDSGSGEARCLGPTRHAVRHLRSERRERHRVVAEAL
jgi:hypothetical protein